MEILTVSIPIILAIIAVPLSIEFFILRTGTASSGTIDTYDRGWSYNWVDSWKTGFRHYEAFVVHTYINRKYLMLYPLMLNYPFDSHYYKNQTVKIKYSTVFPNTCVIDDKRQTRNRYILLGVLMLAAVWLCLMIVRQ